MKRFRCLVIPGFITASLFLAAQPVFAAEEGGAASPLTVAFQWLNFAIVAGGIGWLLLKKAPGYFAARAAQIASAIEEAARRKAEAEERRRDAEQRLANLASEIEGLRASSRKDVAAEAERIRAATRDESAKIERAAQAEVEAAARSSGQELRALAARLCIERAEVVLRAEMTPAAEAGIFTTFIGELASPSGRAGSPN